MFDVGSFAPLLFRNVVTRDYILYRWCGVTATNQMFTFSFTAKTKCSLFPSRTDMGPRMSPSSSCIDDRVSLLRLASIQSSRSSTHHPVQMTGYHGFGLFLYIRPDRPHLWASVRKRKPGSRVRPPGQRRPAPNVDLDHRLRGADFGLVVNRLDPYNAPVVQSIRGCDWMGMVVLPMESRVIPNFVHRQTRSPHPKSPARFISQTTTATTHHGR
jgi:hypothetical protein